MSKIDIEKVKEKLSFNKIAKFNIIIILCFSLVGILQLLSLGEISSTFAVIISAFLAVVFYLLYYFKLIKNEVITSLGISFSAMFNVFYLLNLDKGDAATLLLFIVYISLVALYLRKDILLIFGIALNIVLVVYNIFYHENLVGIDGKDSFISILMIIDMGLVILYFLTKWGNELINGLDDAYKKLNESAHYNNKIIKQVQISASEVAKASNEVYNQSEQLSKRTQDQSASLEEITSSMEELSSTVTQSSENTQNANILANEVVSVLKQGNEILNNTANAMEKATKASKKIDEISSVVNDIAFQTNILALNASVEATRAGEHGKGFAVVATEVRNLAQKCADAASEIQELTSDNVLNNENGNKLVKETIKYINNVTNNINNMANIMSEVATASTQQNGGIQQINKAIYQINKHTQSNAMLSNQSVDISDNLQSHAVKLINLMSKLDNENVS